MDFLKIMAFTGVAGIVIGFCCEMLYQATADGSFPVFGTLWLWIFQCFLVGGIGLWLIIKLSDILWKD